MFIHSFHSKVEISKEPLSISHPVEYIIETIDSYSQLNARISWTPNSEEYEISVYGSNLTDELSYANDYAVTGLADGVRRNGRPISPRIYGVEIAVFF